uniref:Uncharacterized protein n=1 Tax=Apteryx owenii TaxID=8824 RepID=A0A8B9Q7J7_APTOW
EEEPFEKPTLSIAKDHIVMTPSLIFVCRVDRGAPSVSWLLREDLKEDPRVHINNCRNNTRQSCSMLVIRKVTANDTGYFTYHRHGIAVPLWSLTRKGTVLQINLLFPADYSNPFVEIHSEHPDIIYILDEKKTVVVPCRVTSPDIKPKKATAISF